MRAPTVPPELTPYGVAVAAVAVALWSAFAKLDVLEVDVDWVAGVTAGANAVLSSAIRAMTESRLTTC
jgi:hypothetical protein